VGRIAKDLMTVRQLEDFNFLKRREYRDIDALKAVGRLDLAGAPLPKVGPSGAYNRDELVSYLRHMRNLRYGAADIAITLGVETHRVIYWLGRLS